MEQTEITEAPELETPEVTEAPEGTEAEGTEAVTEEAPLPVDVEKLKSLTPEQRQKFFEAIGDLPFEYQVNGKKLEKPLKEVRKTFQKELAADEKFQKSSEMMKKAEFFFSMLQKDPAGTLQKMGYDVDELAKQRVRAMIEQESMSPEQRELLQERQRRLQLEQQMQLQAQKQQQAQAEMAKKQQLEHYKKAIPEALKANGLPQTDHNTKRLAQYLHTMKKGGWAEATIEDAAAQMAEDLKVEFKQYFEKGDPNHAISVLGKEFVEKMRKHSLEDIPTPQKQFTRPPKGVARSQTSKRKDNRMSAQEWRDWIDSRV